MPFLASGTDAVHVVTLGGGTGHAQLLRALKRFGCQITAIAAITDDGGCSGRLREALGMPPPGDLRRCLTALATRRERAQEMEWRTDDGRCLGNLRLAAACSRHDDIQRAVDQTAWWLGVRGRVVPAALSAGTLAARFDDGRWISGECNVAAERRRITDLTVEASRQNPAAAEALRNADWIILGPGSFYTSVLATALTPGVRQALLDCSAPKLLIPNLGPEDEKTLGFSERDYLNELERRVALPGRRLGARLLGTEPLPRDAAGRHCPGALAEALDAPLADAVRSARGPATAQVANVPA